MEGYLSKDKYIDHSMQSAINGVNLSDPNAMSQIYGQRAAELLGKIKRGELTLTQIEEENAKLNLYAGPEFHRTKLELHGKLLSEILMFYPGLLILDVGCGNGPLLDNIQRPLIPDYLQLDFNLKENFNYRGIDIVEEEIELAKMLHSDFANRFHHMSHKEYLEKLNQQKKQIEISGCVSRSESLDIDIAAFPGVMNSVPNALEMVEDFFEIANIGVIVDFNSKKKFNENGVFKRTHSNVFEMMKLHHQIYSLISKYPNGCYAYLDSKKYPYELFFLMKDYLLVEGEISSQLSYITQERSEMILIFDDEESIFHYVKNASRPSPAIFFILYQKIILPSLLKKRSQQ